MPGAQLLFRTRFEPIEPISAWAANGAVVAVVATAAANTYFSLLGPMSRVLSHAVGVFVFNLAESSAFRSRSNAIPSFIVSVVWRDQVSPSDTLRHR